jgi:hypothetical protein
MGTDHSGVRRRDNAMPTGGEDAQGGRLAVIGGDAYRTAEVSSRALGRSEWPAITERGALSVRGPVTPGSRLQVVEATELQDDLRIRRHECPRWTGSVKETDLGAATRARGRPTLGRLAAAAGATGSLQVTAAADVKGTLTVSERQPLRVSSVAPPVRTRAPRRVDGYGAGTLHVRGSTVLEGGLWRTPGNSEEVAESTELGGCWPCVGDDARWSASTSSGTNQRATLNAGAPRWRTASWWLPGASPQTSAGHQRLPG